jgi:hypothetical protein
MSFFLSGTINGQVALQVRAMNALVFLKYKTRALWVKRCRLADLMIAIRFIFFEKIDVGFLFQSKFSTRVKVIDFGF